TSFGYPFRWVYSALRATDHLRAAALHEGREPDPRMTDAIEVIRAARDEDGRWRQDRVHPGRVWFPVDADEGGPSKWLTFTALRVLDWWDAAART
ncbi:MAG: squalene cyclase, partial [Amnibacterium sp.]